MAAKHVVGDSEHSRYEGSNLANRVVLRPATQAAVDITAELIKGLLAIPDARVELDFSVSVKVYDGANLEGGNWDPRVVIKPPM